jgi:hypothetical protein
MVVAITAFKWPVVSVIYQTPDGALIDVSGNSPTVPRLILAALQTKLPLMFVVEHVTGRPRGEQGRPDQLVRRGIKSEVGEKYANDMNILDRTSIP